MHPLIRKTGCWKEKRFFWVVQHFQIWLCFYQEQPPEHKPTILCKPMFFTRQLLPQGCTLRGLPNNVNRKALEALKQSEELLSITGSEQPRPPITCLPRSWADDLADEREDSKSPLEFSYLKSLSFTQMKFKVYTTQVNRKSTSADIMTGTTYSHLKVWIADLFVRWIDVKMPLVIYMCSDYAILIIQCQDLDYCEQYVSECNTDFDAGSADWWSKITS